MAEVHREQDGSEENRAERGAGRDPDARLRVDRPGERRENPELASRGREQQAPRHAHPPDPGEQRVEGEEGDADGAGGPDLPRRDGGRETEREEGDQTVEREKPLPQHARGVEREEQGNPGRGLDEEEAERSNDHRSPRSADRFLRRRGRSRGRRGDLLLRGKDLLEIGARHEERGGPAGNLDGDAAR